MQCHIENYKNPENFSKSQPSVSFLPQPILTSRETAENEGHCSLRGNDTTYDCNIVSNSFTTKRQTMLMMQIRHSYNLRSRCCNMGNCIIFRVQIVFSFAAVQLFEAGNAKKNVRFMHFCNILSRKMQILQDFCKS